MTGLIGYPDTVEVYPEVEGSDSDDNRVLVPSATPVTVACLVQPGAATETAVDGQQTVTTLRVQAPSWPGGAHARVEWQGRPFAVVGEPQHHPGTLTGHVTVTLRAHGPAPSGS